MTVLFDGMTMKLNGTQLIRLSFVIKLSSRRYLLTYLYLGTVGLLSLVDGFIVNKCNAQCSKNVN